MTRLKSFKKVYRIVNVALFVLSLIVLALIWNGVFPTWTGMFAWGVVLIWVAFGLVLEIKDSRRRGA